LMADDLPSEDEEKNEEEEEEVVKEEKKPEKKKKKGGQDKFYLEHCEKLHLKNHIIRNSSSIFNPHNRNKGTW